MTQGDVAWVRLPYRSGHEQAGERPAVVMQCSAASARLQTTVIVPLTGQIDALRFPGTVAITPTAGNGLLRLSVALTHQIVAVDVRQLGVTMGHLSADQIRAIREALDEVIGPEPWEPTEGS